MAREKLEKVDLLMCTYFQAQRRFYVHTHFLNSESLQCLVVSIHASVTSYMHS